MSDQIAAGTAEQVHEAEYLLGLFVEEPRLYTEVFRGEAA